jgi:hypothetical protein
LFLQYWGLPSQPEALSSNPNTSKNHLTDTGWSVEQEFISELEIQYFDIHIYLQMLILLFLLL